MNEAERRARGASFGIGADAYERARPAYPEAALDWLLPAWPDPAARRLLDLGAGTGKLTRQLVARGLNVVAVDPSAQMRAQLRRVLPGVEALDGAAEAIPASDAAFDAVFVAQAWHWFDATAACAEVARVLKPGGTLALAWNTRDTRIEWVARLAHIIDAGRPAGDAAPELSALFGPLASQEWSWSFRLDEAGFLHLAASRSAFFVATETDRAAVLERVRELFDEVASASHGDPGARSVELPYRARCFRCVRVG